MSKSAVDHMDVRWRVKGTQQWSTPRAYKPAAEVAVNGLERNKQYEFEARNVSACGATSVWVSSDYTVPPPPVDTLTLIGMQQDIQDADSAAAAANAELAAIASDNVLSPAEKPNVMRDYSVITTEQAGIDAQATQYGVTTQKSDYDNAISTLTAYLNTLNTPVPWNNKSGNTDITGSVFRGYFNDVYTARQVLLNAIYAAAKGLADNARSVADGAQDTADDAQNTANANTSLLQNAFFATGDLTGWHADNGTYVYERGTSGPLPGTSSYAKRVGNATTPTDPLRNSGRIPVVLGSVVKGSCNIRGLAANGTAGVRISWRNSSDAEIAVTSNDLTLTGTFNFGATVVGAAPANAVWAVIEGSVRNHTSGTYTFDNFAASGGADNLDQLPDGPTYGKVNGSNLSGGNVDMSSTTIANKNLDYIPDGGVRIGGTQYSDAETVDNANFEAASTTPVPGWTSVSATLGYASGVFAYAGNRSLQVIPTAANGFARSTRRYKCTPGDVYLVVAQIYGAASGVTAGLQFFSSSGGFVGTRNAGSRNATGFGLTGGQVQVPAGADYFFIIFVGVASGTQFLVDDIALGKVRTQNGIAPITWAGVRSVLSSSPISYSISGTTVSFSVAAFTNYGGGNNPSYSAAGASVTQAAGTTATYYLYFRDPTSSGGSQTLYVTTNVKDLATYPDVVNIGSADVTVAAGGGGSGGTGGGGGGFCVADEMWVRDGLRAGDADIGDPFDCIDLPTAAGKHVRALQGLTRGIEECVRLITADGCALVCSVSTPFDLPDGRSAMALQMLGEQVITDLGTAAVTSLALVGPRPVMRAHLGGVSYAAGADPHRRVYSHNAGGTIKKP